PGAPGGDDLPESMQGSYKMMRFASANATMVVGGVEALQSTPLTPPNPPALVTSTGYTVQAAPSVLTAPAPGPLVLAMTSASNATKENQKKSNAAEEN